MSVPPRSDREWRIMFNLLLAFALLCAGVGIKLALDNPAFEHQPKGNN